MYVTYVVVAVILVLIGIVSSVYFIRFLKVSNLQEIAVPALSESLNTFFIGIFYFYCAIVIAQHILPTTQTTDNENDITIIEEDKNMTKYQEGDWTTEVNEDIGDKITTTGTLIDYEYPNQAFLANYQAFLKQHSIKEKREFEGSTTVTPVQGNGTTEFQPEKCFEQLFMEYSMFLYSFLHSVISLVLQTKGTGADITEKRSKRGAQEDSHSEPNSVHVGCSRFKLILGILLIFLTPIACIIALYYAMDQNVEMNLVTKLYPSDTVDVWDIIRKPINISIPEKKKEINDIVRNIYTIVNESRNATTPMKYEYYNLSTRRRPKQLEVCSDLELFHRIYTVLVFLSYFLTILYTKIKEAQMSVSSEKEAKQLRAWITLFAVLWFCSISELFLKTYLLDGNTYSGVVTEIFLLLGNLNQLSIIVMNYLTAKEMMKKYNLVEPKA